MAKNNLPSVDAGRGIAKGNIDKGDPLVRLPDERVEKLEPQKVRPPSPVKYQGHLTADVSVRLLPGAQRLKFKQIERWLDDSGAKLANGQPVGTKHNRVVMWLIENCVVPAEND